MEANIKKGIPELRNNIQGKKEKLHPGLTEKEAEKINYEVQVLGEMLESNEAIVKLMDAHTSAEKLEAKKEVEKLRKSDLVAVFEKFKLSLSEYDNSFFDQRLARYANYMGVEEEEILSFVGDVSRQMAAVNGKTLDEESVQKSIRYYVSAMDGFLFNLVKYKNPSITSDAWMNSTICVLPTSN